MKAKPQEHELTPDLFRSSLSSILNTRHEMCVLSDLIDWQRFEEQFANYFPSPTVCPAIATRLIVGMMYLNHTGLLKNHIYCIKCKTLDPM